MITHSIGSLSLGTIEAPTDGSAVYYTYYNVVASSGLTCTMIMGKVSTSSPALEWQKKAVATSGYSAWCLFPADIVAYDSSTVYFTATFPSTSDSDVAAVMKASPDGTFTTYEAFGTTDSKTFLFNFIAAGGFFYFHGVSGKTEFQVASRDGLFLVKTNLDFANDQCTQINQHSVTISVVTDTDTTFTDAASMTDMSFATVSLT